MMYTNFYVSLTYVRTFAWLGGGIFYARVRYYAHTCLFWVASSLISRFYANDCLGQVCMVFMYELNMFLLTVVNVILCMVNSISTTCTHVIRYL